jgi:ferritin-like metal-binding protein YciE
MTITTPTDLLFDQLRDIYSFETQLAKAFPNVWRRSINGELRSLLQSHSVTTEAQAGRVHGIFELYGVPLGSYPCKAMAGLIEGGDAHLASAQTSALRDLMVIAHCLRIQEYQRAAYEITRRIAEKVGFEPVVGVLSAHLSEEMAASDGLRELEPRIFELTREPIG